MDMLTYQTAKRSFTFYQRYTFTPDQLKKTLCFSVLLDGRHSYIHTFQRNLSVLSWLIFHLKSVNFLFLFSIYCNRKCVKVKCSCDIDMTITPGSNLTYLVPQDNFSLVPNCFLGPPECETMFPKINLFGLCENVWLPWQPVLILKNGGVPTNSIKS